MTLTALLQSLKSGGHLDDVGISRILSYISTQHSRGNYPWFIKAAIAFGAWVAALCFLSFFGAFGFFVAKGSILVIGIITIAGATLIRRLLNYEFTNQLALASSLSGHCMIFIWLVDRYGFSIPSLAVASAVLCVILYPLYRDVVHRFMSCFLSQMMFLAWLVSLDHPNRIYALVVFQTAVLLFLFTGRSFTGRGLSGAERPLAHATAVALIVCIGTMALIPEFPEEGLIMVWPAKILFSAVLIYLYVWATRREDRKWNMAMTTAVVITIALGIMTAPGILVALALMVIGYEREDHLLTGIGIAVFPFFIWFYYYNLNLNLMTKSFILMGSGAILLGARLYMSRFVDEYGRPTELAVSRGAE